MSRRYEHTSIFNRNFWTNKILLGSILLSIGLVFVAIYGPHISDFLAFASLSTEYWLYVYIATGIFLAAFELLKLFKRRRRKA